MTADLIPLLAAVSAALIAGYFSFVTLINSKEQKTSEFRQNWIDSLRKEIAEFTSSVHFLKFYYQQDAKNTAPEFINGLKEIHNKYASSSTAILLRVNATEKDKYLKAVNDAFLCALSDVLKSVDASQYDEAATRCGTLIDKAKPLLKEEWKRVKAGERNYRVIKCFSIALFVGAAFCALYISGTSRDINKHSSQNADNAVASKPDKDNNSQNCTLSVSLEPSKPVKQISSLGKINKCNEFSEQ